MAYRIKAEDVPSEFVGYGVKGCGPISKDLISEILNHAIEAGLVSPPVWAIIDWEGDAIGLYETQNEAEHYKDHGETVAVWKGQTE
jgi:hypothetical protein